MSKAARSLAKLLMKSRVSKLRRVLILLKEFSMTKRMADLKLNCKQYVLVSNLVKNLKKYEILSNRVSKQTAFNTFRSFPISKPELPYTN